MKTLIRFWESQLSKNRWFMDPTTRDMIRETIRVLKSIEREQRKPLVVRQAEYITRKLK